MKNIKNYHFIFLMLCYFNYKLHKKNTLKNINRFKNNKNYSIKRTDRYVYYYFIVYLYNS